MLLQQLYTIFLTRTKIYLSQFQTLAVMLIIISYLILCPAVGICIFTINGPVRAYFRTFLVKQIFFESFFHFSYHWKLIKTELYSIIIIIEKTFMLFANKQIVFIFIFSLLLTIVYPQSTSASGSTACQDPPVQNLLQSGTYSLTNQRVQNSRINNFQIVVNYNIPSWGLNVAVSTGRIVGFNQAAGTDYSIRGGRLENTNIANFILSINQDISWTSIRASFLISSRNDFFLGAFLPDTFSLFGSSDTSLLAQYIIPNWAPSSTSVSFIYLISGLKTTDNSYNIDLSQAGFNNQTGLISVRVNTNAKPYIQMIYISYILFFNTAPYSLSLYNPLSSSQPASTHFFQGIDSIAGNSIVYEGYAINLASSASQTLPCIGSNCPSNCVTRLRCTSTGGFIQLNQCYMCGFQQVFSNNQCFNRCSVNQTWSGSACQCRTGYTRVNGLCRIISCTSLEVWNGLQCVCINGYQRFGKECQLLCPSLSSWNGKQCVCDSGYVRINDICAFRCATNAYLNETGSCLCLPNFIRNTFNQCVQSFCGSNQVFDVSENRCICRDGFLFSRNQCLPKCPGDFTNAILYQGACVCIEGFDISKGRCVRILNCTKQFQIQLNNQQCACINGYQYNSFRFCVPNCGSNQVLVNDLCQCANNFVRNAVGFCVASCSTNQYAANGICTCIPGFGRNSDRVCVKICGQNQYLINNQCFCLNGYVRSPTTGLCIIQNQCVLNQVLLNGTCRCVEGFIQVGNVCVSICRVNQIFDKATNGCVCKQGYGISSANRLCDVCPANSRSSGLLTGCICNTGYKWNSNTLRCQFVVCQPNSSLSPSGICLCNKEYYLQGTQCKKIPTCPWRSTWNQQRLACVCNLKAQYLINNVCQPCRNNSAWNGSACVCRTGFNLVNGNCVQCSANSQFLRGNCVCNFGYFGDGFTCTPCFSTCETCSNSFSNSCLTCVNVSYTLTNGFCNLKTCNTGSFYNSTTARCDKCIDYCATCSNTVSCDSCITGFQLIYASLSSSTLIGCGQICGDGKKFYLGCDDGNNVSNDGCSSTCSVQSGWTCVGGSATSRSQCSNIIPTSSIIIPGGNVALQTQVLQGISMTYLPQSLTNNGCPLCSNILNISITNATIIPQITVSYITASQYKFVVRFMFGVLITNQFFTFSVRINNSFNSYFSASDMQQVKIVSVNLAKLALFESVGALTFENASNSTTNTVSNSVSPTITIPGVPAQAVAILFPN